MRHQNLIEIVPDKRGGKPCVAGSRIAVADVLGWMANGMSERDIIDDFQELSAEQIRACLAFAAER